MTAVVCVTLAPVAFMVILWSPSATLLPTVTVMVDLPAPGFAMVPGLKLTVTPPG